MRISFLLFLLYIWSNTLGQTPVDTAEAITIGGIKQYITLKGKDNTKPLLLFLHGGPGNSVMSYAHKFTQKLQENFIVVQWDQRETGETLKLNPSPVPLTLTLFQNDSHELIKHLLKKFQRSKLYLIGHSWGTVLGFHIAAQYPGLLHAWIPISPVINQLESERIILKLMKEKASQLGNKIEIEELATVNIPFENGEQLYYHRKWLFHFNGKPRKNFSKSVVTAWASTWLSVWNEASKINLTESLLEINCPVYFFSGRKDYQTNFSITADYYKKLKAPKKGLFWFEKSAHSVPSNEPLLMQDIIINKILPETF